MSDEIHMEAAYRHRDLAAGEPWHGKSPADELMEMEEYDPAEHYDRVAMMRALIVYLFADRHPQIWETVAYRAYTMLAKCATGTLLCGRERVDVAPLARKTVGLLTDKGFVLNDYVALCEDECFRKVLGEVMDYMFPPRKQWLFKGTQRVYLLAKAYSPLSVRTTQGRELSYEDLAAIFEGVDLSNARNRDRARSRWSARAQEVLRKPIEQAGGSGGLQFSKKSEARAKMAESARGNRNRSANVQGDGSSDTNTQPTR